MPVPPSSQAAQASAAAVAERAVLEIRSLWPDLEGVDAVLMRDRIMGVLPTIVRPHYEASAGLAADWYTTVRPRSAGALNLKLAEELGDARLRSLVGESLAPLFEPGSQRNFLWAQQRTEGLIEEVVLSGFRDTIQLTSVEDPAAEWWERIVSPGRCKWCAQFAGERYRKAGQFQSHRHCRCTNAPVFAQKWYDRDRERAEAELHRAEEQRRKAEAEKLKAARPRQLHMIRGELFAAMERLTSEWGEPGSSSAEVAYAKQLDNEVRLYADLVELEAVRRYAFGGTDTP